MDSNIDSIYWFFSSSAQAIATLVAFLLAGYALVINMMDNFQAKDDTLSEIHSTLKVGYYKRIKLIGILTGLSIILSLYMLVLNGTTFDNDFKLFAYYTTALLNVFVVYYAIKFVINIIDPQKYKKTAEKIIKEDKKDFPDTGDPVVTAIFNNAYYALTQSINKYFETNNIPKPNFKTAYTKNTQELANHNQESFKFMVEYFYENNLITKEQFEDLMNIYRFRNLVIHGKIAKIDVSMFDLTNKYKEFFESSIV